MTRPDFLGSRLIMTLGIAVAFLAVTVTGAESAPVNVYNNDFQTAVGAGWSVDSGALGLDALPGTGTHVPNNDQFLGLSDANPSLGLNRNTATLSLAGLPAHTSATVTFHLYLFNSWDGNNSDIIQAGATAGELIGPDGFQFKADGSTQMDTRFANTPTFLDPDGSTLHTITQCFLSNASPNCPQSNAPQTGADDPTTASGEPNTLGSGASYFKSAVYALSFTFAHASATLGLDWIGNLLNCDTTSTQPGVPDCNTSGVPPGSHIDDESWGLDNVRIDLEVPEQGGVPEPASLLLLGTGLAGLAGWRFRRPKA